MALSDRLMQDLRNTLPGVLDDVIARELLNTIRDLCREYWVWRETIEVTLEAGTQTYSIAPAGAEIVNVLSVSHDTLDTRQVVFEFGNLFFGTVPAITDIGEPAFVVAVVSPVNDVSLSDIESWWAEDLWSTHHDVVLSGAKARLMAHPAKPYSNATMAQFYHRDYKGKAATARLQTRLANAVSGQQWVFPSFSKPWGA